MLLQKFNIDTEKIKKRNKELIDMKLMDKLSSSQKKFLNFYKGPGNQTINSNGFFGYTDLSNYLINPDKFSEISLKHLEQYLAVYNINIQKCNSEALKKYLVEINNNRIKNIKKYLNYGDSLFKKGIHSNDIIYRVQEKPIEGNIIKNITSWSLAPIEWFCWNSSECHLYITKIPKDIKVFYLENNSKDKDLKIFDDFPFYEFEYLLPRNLEFKEIKTKKIKIINKFFNDKNENRNKEKYQIFNIHYIKIIKKNKNIELPKIDTIKLIINL
jgi:hypothetical protein